MLNFNIPSNLSSQTYEKRKLLLVLYLKTSILGMYGWEIRSTKRWCSSIETAAIVPIAVPCCWFLCFKIDNKKLERFKKNYDKEWFKVWKACLYNYKLKGKGEGLTIAYQHLHGKDFWWYHDSFNERHTRNNSSSKDAPAKFWKCLTFPIRMTYLGPSYVLRLAGSVCLF